MHKLRRALYEQRKLRRQLEIVESAHRQRLAAPPRVRRLRPDEDEREALLRLDQFTRQFLRADALQARIGDDDVRSLAVQSDQSAAASRDADDRKAGLFQGRVVRDALFIREQEDAPLLFACPLARGITVRLRCSAHKNPTRD